MSRRGYHAAWARVIAPRLAANEALLGRMHAIHSHRYGSPRMARELRDTGSPCSENRVARVVRAAGLRVRARSPYRSKTTQIDPAAAPSPNRLTQADPPVARHAPGQRHHLPSHQGGVALSRGRHRSL